MSFNPRSFVRIAGAPVGSVAGTSNLNQVFAFLYATDDAAAVVEANGYFNVPRGLITIGTKISAMMNVAAGVAGTGTPVYKEYIVTAVPTGGGNVTVALQSTAAG